MNLETWRKIKNLPWQEADKILSDIYEEGNQKAKVYAYKDGFSCVFTALHRRFPEWGGQMLHSIAVDAVELQKGIETPEELIQTLFDETGFDIRAKVADQPFEYIPIRQKRESRALLPCKCGGKRREHWYDPDSALPEGLKCMTCGLMVWGKGERDVIRRWNEEVKKDGR